jgi:hypothetical protein
MTRQRRSQRPILAIAAVVAAMTAWAPAGAALAQYDTRYDADQARYQADLAREDQARRDYDARYGYGAYDRYYAARRDYDARYGDGAYDRYYGASAESAYREDRRACHDEKKGNEVAGGLLGGIAGAVIGSNVAKGGGRTGGAIIGGVGGAALGSQIAKGATHCD